MLKELERDALITSTPSNNEINPSTVASASRFQTISNPENKTCFQNRPIPAANIYTIESGNIQPQRKFILLFHLFFLLFQTFRCVQVIRSKI